jgi:hypothetical protein
MADHRDGCIETLAYAEAALQEEVVAYRELACAAITAVHDLALQHARLRERHHRLIEQYRQLRHVKGEAP